MKIKSLEQLQFLKHAIQFGININIYSHPDAIMMADKIVKKINKNIKKFKDKK